MQASKSKAGGLQEPHHSDSACTPEPQEFTSSFDETPKMSKEEEGKKGIMERETMSQVITRKLKEVRKNTDVLVVDGEIESRIRSSIVQEISPEAPKNSKKTRRE